MPQVTIASVTAGFEAKLDRADALVADLQAAVRDQAAALRKEQSEHEATRQQNERLRHEHRLAEQNVALLRGFALAKLSAAEMEALPLEFADFLRGTSTPMGTDRYAWAGASRFA